MAQFVNMHVVDLTKGSAPKKPLGVIHEGDHLANRCGAIVMMGKAPQALGGNCAGTAILQDGSTVPLTGTISDNEAYVELDNACYQVEGAITVHVKWVSGSLETTLISFYGTVEITATGAVIQPSTPIPDLPQLLASIEEMRAATEDAEDAAETANTAAVAAYEGKPTVYCWGDSLTEGVGGWIMPPDGHNAYMAYSYPAWLAQTYDVVNLGARSENIPAIMARQGADPIVLQESLSIPASKDTPVLVQQVTQIYSQTQGQGFTSKSGAMVKIHKEVESPGVNPCVIAGVEGILYRELTSEPLDNETTYNYYFKRLENGAAVTAAAGEEIKTYAMLHCRKGVAVIWMGANGGYSSAADFVAKVEAMVEYGKYANYLVIISREFSGSDIADIKSALTDEQGVCHVISLMDELPYRGYAMAGIQRKSIDTSEWSTADPVKKNAPLLCEYLGAQNPPNVYIADGGTGLNVYVGGNALAEEDRYGALHYSTWGYKAIGMLVAEKLGTMELVRRGGHQKDAYGTLLYKLASPQTLTGHNYINTGVKLFDDVTKDWTVAIKWSGTPASPDGYPANILCCAKDGAWKGLLYRYYQANGANLLFGSAVFVIDGDHNMIDNYGGTNVLVISKEGDSYAVFLNSETMAYGQHLEYALTDADAITLPLIIGARYSSSGEAIQYKTGFTVEDVRIYDSALSDADAAALYNELAGGE